MKHAGMVMITADPVELYWCLLLSVLDPVKYKCTVPHHETDWSPYEHKGDQEPFSEEEQLVYGGIVCPVFIKSSVL